MPGTASSTVVERTRDVRAVAAMIALAYLRNLREGDSLRASVVLAAFQQFWSDNRATIVPDPPPSTGIPAGLRASGMLDQETQNALVFVLWQNELISDEVAGTSGFGTTVLMTQVYPRVRVIGGTGSGLFEAYRVSRRVAPQDAGLEVARWAVEAVEGISPMVPTDPQPPLPGPGDDRYFTPPAELIFAVPFKRKAPVMWPWVLAGVVLVGMGVGFAYRKKRRR